MKTALALLVMTMTAPAFGENIKWASVYVDTDKECVSVAESVENVDSIDFSKRECKAFGGYQFFIEGADLRYSPTLEFRGKVVFSHREFAFHNMGASKVEWVYSHETPANSKGELKWRGLIYRLAVATEDGSPDKSKLYALRLNGLKTCSLGEAANNESARAMIYNPATPCEK